MGFPRNHWWRVWAARLEQVRQTIVPIHVIKRLKPGRRKRKGKRVRAQVGEARADGVPIEIVQTIPGKQIKPPIIFTATPSKAGVKQLIGAAAGVTTVTVIPEDADYVQDWSDYAGYVDQVPTFTIGGLVAGESMETDSEMLLSANPDLGGFDPATYPWQRTFVSSPERESGSAVYRVENRRNVVDGFGRTRLELFYGLGPIATQGIQSFANSCRFDTEYWLGWSIYLDPTWPTSSPFFMNVGHSIGVNDGSGSLGFLNCSPSNGTACRLQVHADPDPGTGGTPQTQVYGGSGNNFKTGQWYDIIWHVRPSLNSSGYIQCYVKDTVTDIEELTLDYSGILAGKAGTTDDGATGADQFRPTLGLYGGTNTEAQTYIAYYSTVRAHIGANGKSIVSPRD